MNSTLRTLALSGLRVRYPQATLDDLRRGLADLWLGPESAARVYGPRRMSMWKGNWPMSEMRFSQ
jgi:hypothetical protein